MTTIRDNKTSAQFIHDNQAEIAEALNGDGFTTELKLRNLLRNSFTAGFNAGLDKMRRIAVETYAK